MSPRVSLSWKMATALLEVVERHIGECPHFFGAMSKFEKAAAEELRRALKPKPKKPSVKAKAAKKASKREETYAIRAAVVARAGGRCELCVFDSAGTDMHHAFGRVRVPQSVSNCVLLCRSCHRDIEGKEPEVMQACLAAHFRKHGYLNEERRLVANVKWKQTKKSFAKAGAR